VAYDQVDFLVGGFRTEAVLAMQDIAMDYKKVFIGCGAAHPELCLRVGKDYGRYKYFFRGTPVNSRRLVQTSFLQLVYVGAILKKELNLPKLKVAVVAEQPVWADPMVEAARKTLPRLGMELVGIWRVSQTAKDVTEELSEVQRADANLIFTIFSSSVGLTFAKQAGQMKMPAAMVGVNVEAQKDGFWQATEGLANYVMTLNTYSRDVVINETTQPFIEAYVRRYGETPTYTADTYAAIKLLLKPAVERADSLNPDKIVAELEKTDQTVPSGRVKFDADHDLTWGAGYLTGLGVQWQDGRLVAVWPRGWEGITYQGTVPYKIAPWLAEKYKRR
jgi:branched-chain amino acid transport system substrate-binding protein